MRVGARAGHLEPVLLDRLHRIRADLAPILEMDADVPESGGDHLVVVALQEPTALPLVEEDQPSKPALRPQDDGVPGTAFELLALDLDRLPLRQPNARGTGDRSSPPPCGSHGTAPGSLRPFPFLDRVGAMMARAAMPLYSPASPSAARVFLAGARGSGMVAIFSHPDRLRPGRPIIGEAESGLLRGHRTRHRPQRNPVVCRTF